MAKQGQHNNDHSDNDRSRGPNNHDKSVPITAGNVKKRETYAEQARTHDDPGKQAQFQKNEWDNEQYDVSPNGGIRARDSDVGNGRSGSDSNASKSSQGH